MSGVRQFCEIRIKTCSKYKREKELDMGSSNYGLKSSGMLSLENSRIAGSSSLGNMIQRII